MKIKVMYRCAECGLDKIKVKVGQRYPNESIIAWSNRVMEVCAANHAIRSPLCRPRTLDLYFPLPKGNDAIGASENPSPTEEEKKAWKDAIERSGK